MEPRVLKDLKALLEELAQFPDILKDVTYNEETGNLQYNGNPIANLNDVYTKTAIDDLIKGITSFEILTMDGLPESPAVGNEKKIHFVKVADASGNDIHDEYLWINGAWELVGTTRIDLSNYYTSAEVDALLQSITSFEYKIFGDDVTELPAAPAEGDEKKFHFLKVVDGKDNDHYDEYLWVSGAWEKVGSTRVDFSQYYTKTEVDTLLTPVEVEGDTLPETPVVGNERRIHLLRNTNTTPGKDYDAYVWIPAKGEGENVVAAHWQALGSTPEYQLPSIITTDAGKILRVNSGGNGYELAEASTFVTVENSIVASETISEIDVPELITGIEVDVHLEGIKLDRGRHFILDLDNKKIKFTSPVEAGEIINYVLRQKEGQVIAGATPPVQDLTPYALKSETYTKTEVENLINAIRSSIGIVITTELPEAPEEGNERKFYLVPINPQDGSLNNYIEYVWTGTKWESLGNREITLENYYTKEEVEQNFAKISKLTQAEYDGLAIKSPNTIYVIIEQ